MTVQSETVSFAAILVAAVVLTYKFASQSQKPAGKKSRPSRSARSPKDSTKKFIIGGNWKSACGYEKSRDLVDMMNSLQNIPRNIEVFVAPSSPFLTMVSESLQDGIAVAAQDVGNHTKPGARTGEAFATMLSDVGCEWVICGHSERRQYQKESSSLVAEKAKVALDNGLGVVVCIGESLEERESGRLEEVLCSDMMSTLAGSIGSAPQTWANVVIAYEPVWAVGTGKTAKPADAQSTHAMIRNWVSKNVSASVASALRIQYGGSVKPGNAKELAACPDIDGFLIGGAALKPDFLEVIANAAAGLQ